MIDLDQADERDAAAAEFVLGTLGTDDHAQVAAALETDANLRALVGQWQDRLLPLSARSAAVQPGAALWPRIERGIFSGAAAASASPASDVASATAPAPAAATPQAPEPPPPMRTRPRPAPSAAGLPWWQRLGLWQGFSAAAVAACLVLAVMLLSPTGRGLPGAAPQARYVAMLLSPDGRETGWVVEATEGGTVRLVPSATADAIPQGRVWQFWTKAEGAAGPTSLGLVTSRRTVELPASALPELSDRQLFEITLEPEGGSTIGRPTGPILYVGRSVRL